tara:strand:- start:806 stop:1537 length:732 start_codon:yes stop_codon:yes gene_type:complete
MSRISFENYGLKAKYYKNETKVAGRFKIQEKAEKNILIDVINKMSINSDDNLLDIGCGSGNLLIPLSFVCKQVSGIDHVSCIERLNKRIKKIKNIECILGNFLDISMDRKFDKILCYSVLHYLTDEDEVIMFIHKALKLLKPGGIALFGDIPNTSLKQRFLNSKSGIEFSKKWARVIQGENQPKNSIKLNLVKDKALVQFNDDLVLKILRNTRAKGFDSSVLTQPPHLPFGYTREDILIKNPD